MKGYFITEAQLSNLKVSLTLDTLRPGPYTGEKKLQPVIDAIYISIQQDISQNLETWIQLISKD